MLKITCYDITNIKKETTIRINRHKFIKSVYLRCPFRSFELRSDKSLRLRSCYFAALLLVAPRFPRAVAGLSVIEFSILLCRRSGSNESKKLSGCIFSPFFSIAYNITGFLPLHFTNIRLID